MQAEDVLQRLQSAALVLDESERGKVEVFGPEAALFLHNLSTADVKGMPVGAGSEAFFGNARARAVAWGNIYHVLLSQGRDAFWIDLPAGESSTLMGHLDRHLISEQAEFADKTDGFGQFHLFGTGARKSLEALVGEPIPDLEPWQHMERTLGGRVIAHIRRRDALGFAGYDLVFQAKHHEFVRGLLLAEGLEFVIPAEVDWARIAAGLPAWGPEIGPETFISEVGRNRFAVSSTKGCYLGQEPIVMARDRGQIGKRLTLLALSGHPGKLPVVLKQGDKEAGFLTSFSVHPSRGIIGLGYVRRNWWNLGEKLIAGEVEATCVGPATPD